ncbi:MAG: nucleoside-diphosphate sugar epimerase [Candidatus Thorarchaeota archaeon]|nr:MAG: nucleoside-diphosphate sugar epimerase [Candidatus Thorarchaeota archaeon]
MKVAVLGGSGFIGRYVVEELQSRDIEPLIFDRQYGERHLPEGKHDYFIGDIKDAEQVNYVVKESDGVINLAGILGTAETVNNPIPSIDVNIYGAINVFNACRAHNKKAVQITVGNHFMNNSYAITKSTTERFALMYNKENGTDISIVRALNAYGPRQHHKPIRKVIPNFVLRALNNIPIEVYGDGLQVMDMIFVGDVAEILVDALVDDHRVTETVFEAGTGRKTTILEIANMVNAITGSTGGIKHLPMRQGEPKRSIVIGEPLTLEPLGWLVNDMVKLEDGLQKTVQWYEESKIQL